MWFPGLRTARAEQHAWVDASPESVIAWLTDHSRRRRDAMKLAESGDLVDAPEFDTMPNGALRISYRFRAGDVLAERVITDLSVDGDLVERVMRTTLTSPNKRFRSRWKTTILVAAAPERAGTHLTVQMRMRTTGLLRLFQIFGLWESKISEGSSRTATAECEALVTSLLRGLQQPL